MLNYVDTLLKISFPFPTKKVKHEVCKLGKISNLKTQVF